MRKFTASLLSAAIAVSCLSGVTVLAEEQAENLLVNGSFEGELLGTDGWKYSNRGGWYNEADGTAQKTAAEKYDGEYSIEMNKATVGQRVSLTAGGVYKLTAYAKSATGTTGASIGIYDGTSEWPASSGNDVKAAVVSANSDWQEISLEFECGNTQDYVICLLSWGDSETVYFDDVVLCAISEPEYDGGGVVNGNFAKGTESWTIDGAASAAAGTLTIAGGEARVSQTVEGLENGTYNLTADAAVSDISGECRLYGKTAGHTMVSTAVYQSGTPQKIVVPGIIVEDGICDIGIYSSGSATVTLDNVSLRRSEDTRVQFYKGGEISKLTYVEDMGGKFYREDGSEADALQIMAENGFNLARIRVLNDPGKGHGDGSYYLPAGYQTEEDCLDMARRAKSKGMDILFSFAYSDYWSDGGQQFIPHEWQEYIAANNLSGESMYSYLENQVYEYTKDIMQKLIAQDTCPKFVSIGNEMQLGLFFGGWEGASRDLYMNPSNLARFLKAGARAVKETAPEAKIVLHSDNGGLIYSKNSNFVKTMRLMTADFDVIGVSYYPYYNDGKVSIDNVVSEFGSLISEFNKDVIIMETGYNWTEFKPGGEWDGQLADSGYYQDIYGESQEGQRAFLTELYAKLKQVAGGRCIGDLYWDPVMIHSSEWKIGWAVRESDDYTDSNVVPNSTIFDFEGKAVEGQKAMKYNSDANDTIKISGRAMKGSSIVSNTKLVFIINGSEYETTADKFGEFIAAVPYPADGRFAIAVSGGGEAIEIAAPYDGTMIQLGDIDVSELERVEDKILSLTAAFDEDGALSFNADYTTEKADAVFYAAAYDENGSFIGCVPAKNGRFAAVQQDGSYTVKAFLWDSEQKALCPAAEWNNFNKE